MFEIIRRTFPEGTDDLAGTDVSKAPDWPPDLFAVCAFLLERSGTYQNINPGHGDPAGSVNPTLTHADHEALLGLADEWKKRLSTVPAGVQALWTELLDDGKTKKFNVRIKTGETLPAWVIAAYKLLIIADEVCENTGYVDAPPSSGTPTTVAVIVAFNETNARARGRKHFFHAHGTHSTPVPIFSITQRASMDMLAVQPKSRTAQVGVTMRTFSKHLALLPPVTRINTAWQRFATAGSDDGEDLNLLLIPFPYRIEAGWWTAKTVETNPPLKWGNFELEQRWLEGMTAEQLGAFVSLLAEKSGRTIHGVVFPELSLTTALHRDLTEQLASTNPEIEFVIAGSSDNCDDDKGNFALVSNIYRAPAGGSSGSAAPPANIEHISQGKHHRWRIDPRQCIAYGLTGKLCDDTDWWETMELGRRQIYTHAFRNKSSFAVLICEDLARTDPCHETIRSLGPNIVIALLMDGVQIAQRWPGYYSLGLSEDPGSSVLTFTSRGLIQRAQDENRKQATVMGKSARPPNWSVAMWRDGSSAEVRELHCPPGNDAIILCIKGRKIPERTFDGRIRPEAIRWEFRSAEAFGLSDADRSRMPKAPVG
ncbi:MAG TPA: hypothetical protein PLQ11_02800 [Beijerinckiaceae bacterium]|nr:hypothetical protein [Beijerinckiaceae bacterium]